VHGDAELLHEGEEDQPVKLKPGQTLSVSDRIYTGMETEVVVQTPEGSIYTIRELTDVKLSYYNMDIESIRTRLWLKSGEVTKNTDCHCGIRSDFAIRTPQATCSVRGTSFS
ncbi:FecR domain-containing protein, partial [Arthrospira platensis SPKY1]|nr:FecR domain-containing protein [Arthrospira platensis SPKY1]